MTNENRPGVDPGHLHPAADVLADTISTDLTEVEAVVQVETEYTDDREDDCPVITVITTTGRRLRVIILDDGTEAERAERIRLAGLPECFWPTCRARYDETIAGHEGNTGWRWLPWEHESTAVTVHDHATVGNRPGWFGGDDE
jgi:hypothetical protein